MSDKELSTKHALAGLAVREIEKKKRQQAAGSGSKPRRGNFMLAVIRAVPALLFPFGIYNLMAWGVEGNSIIPDRNPDGTPVLNEAGEMVGTHLAGLAETLSTPLITIPMMSEIDWILSNGDLLIIIAIFCLFWEIIKSTSTGTATIVNHAISMVLFIVCLIQFLLFPNFATSVFFIITMMCLLDVLAGVIVTIVSARRDFGVGEGFGG